MSTTSANTAPELRGRGMTMSDQLGRHARTHGDDVAFVLGPTRRTFRDFDDQVNRLANVLRARGVDVGDRVLLASLNTLEAVATYFAVARVGAVCVPANFRLVADELAFVLSDSGANVIVVHGPLVETVQKAKKIAGHSGPCLVHDGEMEGAEDFAASVAAASGDFAEATVDEGSPAIIMYTSGTTGQPKGAVLTHRNLVMHAFSDVVHRGSTAHDRVLLAATPLFHIAAVSSIMSNLLLGGRTIVLPTGRFDPRAVVDILESERVTACFLVPTQWQAVCALIAEERRELPHLRDIGWGAAPATTTFLRTLIETFPTGEVTTTYGQTECSGVLTVLQGTDSLRKIGSVGKPLLNVEARVVDDQMNDVPRGEVGEFVYRSPMMTAGYWQRPDATAEAFAGGWFHSGDLVRQDADGYFYIVDRKKDMIISGGENIYCAEVEDVLAGHPKVADVALIGVPDSKWGEVPVAVILPLEPTDPPTPADLADWCADRLAPYKRPRRLSIVTELPRNPSGKVLKRQIRADHDAGKLDIQPG